MQTIETSNPIEAQRCRRAQYSGLPLAAPLQGSSIVGLVRSVKEGDGPNWIVTIIPTTPKIPPVVAANRRRRFTR